jgi:hypothetical protein
LISFATKDKPEGGGETKIKDEKLDAKLLNQDVEFVENFIEKFMNRTYYNESKLEEFFEKAFHSNNTEALRNSEKFQSFINEDLTMIITQSSNPESISQWAKFCTRFNVTEPDTWHVLKESFEEFSNRFTVDELLTVLVNISHSLSVDSVKLFDVANVELTKRLRRTYKPSGDEMMILVDDFIKILETLHSFKRLDE